MCSYAPASHSHSLVGILRMMQRRKRQEGTKMQECAFLRARTRDLVSPIKDVKLLPWSLQIKLIQRIANNAADLMAKHAASSQLASREWPAPFRDLHPNHHRAAMVRISILNYDDSGLLGQVYIVSKSKLRKNFDSISNMVEATSYALLQSCMTLP
ncbi:hypothetical protein PIB30_023933 [Stylosanthes scabra]|uniref:Uncharacterized protein n=1 Tax=Stylosanthes scabra TaxID=79078 RepID=A0ABU6V9H6_9FABA|nr:hypothetical protein [Stylosanthes scabra]